MPDIDRTKVRKSFDRGSCRYEDTVVVQKKVIEEIRCRLQDFASSGLPLRILDVGAGTGMLLRSLRTMFPAAFLAGIDLAPGMGSAALDKTVRDEKFLYVEGDAERLPFSDGTFDLVVSTSAFQWLNTLDSAFSEALRVLSPGGTFLFAFFGEGTLCELNNSYRSALLSENALDLDRSHRFFNRDTVVETLARLGFADISVERS
ncbi:MAG TPA: methyltransferase domain-containing protein, partial [Synergistaceae bacterium]|nr:methyltransferase domain-containing protein [Synergistaceae bacterium]